MKFDFQTIGKKKNRIEPTFISPFYKSVLSFPFDELSASLPLPIFRRKRSIFPAQPAAGALNFSPMEIEH